MIANTDLQFLGRAGVNYLQSPGGETGVSGWSLFTTTWSSDVPTTISAGAGNCALLPNKTNPLRGSFSTQFQVNFAGGSAGQGFISDVFTIDNADLAKVLTAAFDYNFSSGGSNVNVSGTSTQTLELWVYNVGLAAWTQPAGYRGINQNSGPGYVAATFQTDSSNASNKNQYRLALIIKNVPAGPFNMQIDQATVGPQTVQYGAPVTDWQTASVGNIVGTGGGALAIGTGGGATYSAKARRIGDSAEVTYTVRIGTVGTADVTGAYQFPFPTGMTPSGLSNYETIGVGEISVVASAAPTNRLIAKAYSTGFILDATDSGLLSAAGNLFNNANTLSVTITYKVQGWSSTVQMSNDTDTRVVALRASRTTNQAAGTGNQDVVFDSVTSVALKEGDTHGAYNTSTGVYTVPVSGYYQITAHVTLTSSVLDQGLLIQTGSGTLLATLFTASGTFSTRNTQGSAVLKFNAGDTFKIVAGRAVSSTVQGSTTDALTTLDVQRLSGPSAIAATETVAEVWNGINAITYASSAANTLKYQTALKSTHGAYSSSTGVFTAPVSGVYNCSMSYTIQAAAIPTSPHIIDAYFTPSAGSQVLSRETRTVVSESLETKILTCSFYLFAGQTLTTQSRVIFSGNAPSNYTADATVHSLSIVRVGN